MRIDILTVLPGLLSGPFSESIVKRGIDKGLVEVHVHNLREWSTNKHKKVDDAPFGTAAGMVLAMQPLHDAITSLQAERDYDEVIFLTPDGEQLKQGRVNQLSLSGNLLMICGHYKGIDQRLARPRRHPWKSASAITSSAAANSRRPSSPTRWSASFLASSATRQVP